MANEVIRAIFEANETISDALNKIFASTETLESGLDDLETEMRNVSNLSNISESELNSLRNSMIALEGATDTSERAVDQFNLTMEELELGVITADEATERLENSLNQLSASSEITDQALDSMESEVNRLAESGALSSGWANRFTDAITDLGRGSVATKEGINILNSEISEAAREMSEATSTAQTYATGLAELSSANIPAIIGQEEFEDAVDDSSDEMKEAAASSMALSSELGILGAIAEASSAEFGSLSVNIGPFNLALRNILVQLPAILTGMGTLLALVTSLAAAFVTLAGTAGALIGAGALAFFDEFKGQFQDTQQAVQALMNALKDLFRDAIEPLMTEANVDLFIGAIEYAARVVNRLAQFFVQMKDEIAGFMDGVGADIDTLFEALHDSFVMMEPILQDVIQWFITGFPSALVRFSELTVRIADELGMLVSSFGDLFFSLMNIAGVLITSIAPILSRIIDGLARVFGVIDSLNDAITASILKFVALTAVFLRFRGIILNVVGAILKLNSIMKAQAATGSFLANTYISLTTAVKSYLFHNMTLSESLAVLRKQMLMNIGITEENIIAKYESISATLSQVFANTALAGAYELAAGAAATFWTVISGGLIPAIAAVVGAIALVVGAIMNWDAITSAVGGTMNFLWNILKGLAKLIVTILIPVMNLLLIPFQVMISLIESIAQGIVNLINGFLEFIGVSEGLSIAGDLFQAILDSIDKANEIAGFLIEQLNRIPGIDIAGPALDPEEVRGQMEGESDEADKDDIQTESNVNLSFEDKLEQNVDVTADPEEKAQMRRIVKDAMNEANSIARRSQGVGR